MSRPKPILWVQASGNLEQLDEVAGTMSERMPDYHVLVTYHTAEQPIMRVLNVRQLKRHELAELRAFIAKRIGSQAL